MVAHVILYPMCLTDGVAPNRHLHLREPGRTMSCLRESSSLHGERGRQGGGEDPI